MLKVFKWLWNVLFVKPFRWYIHLFKGRKWYIKLLSGLMSFIVLTIIYFGMVDINFLGLFGKSPGFYEILNPPRNVASEIFSADGKLIGKYYNENRSPVKYEDVNPVFWDALIDTEDERFFLHKGIDFKGILGAMKDAVMRRKPRGASTITQQLAKNLFRMRTHNSTGLLGEIPGLRMLIIKSKEWIIATKLEMVYDKKEILTMYANTVDFGSNSFGIKTACKTYFNITPQELTVDQSAVLVGMLKATSFYNPVLNPGNSEKRRNVVMTLMVKHGHLSMEEYQSLAAKPTKLSFSVETATNNKYAYFKDAVEHSLEKWCHDSGYDLYTSGLKIYTTIDTRMQTVAEDEVHRQMKETQAKFDASWGNQPPWRDEKGNVMKDFIEKTAQKLPVYDYLHERYHGNEDSINYYLNLPHRVQLFDYNKGMYETEMSTLDSLRHMVKFLHTGFIAMEPQTGAVLAWVGDVDYNIWKYDKVTAMRQPGSTFKMFVYTEAMNQGLTPCDKRRDEAVSIPIYDEKDHTQKYWTPTNASKRFSGDSITLKQAFARSTNSVAVRLGLELGLKNIVRTAHDMGIKSKLDTHPSTILGASDVNLLEMVNAYCTVANDGKVHEPVLVTRIEDSDGNVVYEGPQDAVRAITYKTAYLMQQMLMAGVSEGTSRSLNYYIGPYFSRLDCGGKTGTSNNNSDGWFIAVTPKLVCGAWVGGEYRNIHFASGALGQGARTALPICGRFLIGVLSKSEFANYVSRFVIPGGENINTDLLNCNNKPSYAPSSNESDTLDEQTIPDFDVYDPPPPVESSPYESDPYPPTSPDNMYDF